MVSALTDSIYWGIRKNGRLTYMKLGQDDDDDDDKVDGTVDDGMELAGIRFNRFRNKGRG